MGILNVKALKDWLALRAVNHMLATEKGYYLDARLGPVIQEELDILKANVGEINSNLDVTVLSITSLSDATGSITLYRKCGIVTAQISVVLGKELARYGNMTIGAIPDRQFFPKTEAICAAVWTDKYMQPFNTGYVNIDTYGTIHIRTSDAVSSGYRCYADLMWLTP